MPDEVLLRTERLTRAFGSLLAVDRVDVGVRRGELRSIIGPNGAGKTTFFRLISGEMAPTGGRIWFGGRDITGLPQHVVARLGVAKSYQITNVFPHLTVLENVRVAVQGYQRGLRLLVSCRSSRGRQGPGPRDPGHDRAQPQADRLAAHLSHGEKRHLEIAIALAGGALPPPPRRADGGHEPRGDRGDHGADPPAGRRTRTVVLVEHKMKVVMKISERITVLHQGEVLAEGTPEEIRANGAVQQTYLGAIR